MIERPGSLRRFLPVLSTLLLALVLAGCAENYPQTTLLPRADFGRMVDKLFSTTVFWAVVVFVLVEGAILVAIFKFRGRPDDPEPRQVHGHTGLEVVWTMIPAFILVMIAVPTIKTIFRTSSYATGDVVNVEVIGHQWWWEFRYPELGVVTANEMHVPVNQTVNLRMTSADIIHSFWVPQFAGKRDVFPKKHNPLWFKAEVTGTFNGQCAEFCGEQHARMGFVLHVQSPEEFAAWVANQRVGSPLVNRGLLDSTQARPRDAEADSLEKAGQATFNAGGCIGCHAMVGTALAGVVAAKGPNLSHVGSRTTIVAGMLANTPENLARWLSNPDSVKSGTLMILPRKLTSQEISTLVAYLRSHR
jgi:cytochrome c oxidase subunit 2